jgi:hypothetical protein
MNRGEMDDVIAAYFSCTHGIAAPFIFQYTALWRATNYHRTGRQTLLFFLRFIRWIYEAFGIRLLSWSPPDKGLFAKCRRGGKVYDEHTLAIG